MYREEVAFTMAVLSEARVAIAYVLDGPDELKERLVSKIDEALHIMERPPEDNTADKRRKWREQKRRQRAASRSCPSDSPQDVHADMSADLVVGVVEEEVAVAGVEKKGKEESPPKPPHGGISEKVDEVLSAFNDVAGRDYRTGPKRSKAHARLITARLKQEVEASGGDMDQAATRAVLLVRCYQEKWGDDPKMCDYVRPSTLFQAAKWADRMDDTRRWVTGRNGR